MGGTGAHVDGHVEDLCGHGFIIKPAITVLRVEVPVVDGDGILSRQIGDVEMRVGPLRDAVLALPARCTRVMDIAALMLQHYFHGPQEALVHGGARAHIVTVTSLRLPLKRMCAGPKALGRYPLRSA